MAPTVGRALPSRGGAGERIRPLPKKMPARAQATAVAEGEEMQATKHLGARSPSGNSLRRMPRVHLENRYITTIQAGAHCPRTPYSS